MTGKLQSLENTVIRTTYSVKEIKEQLHHDPFQRVLPWNHVVSLETQAKSFLPCKLDPRFAQQTMLAQDTLAICRKRSSVPVFCLLEGDTNFSGYAQEGDDKVRAYAKISNTPEMKAYRKLFRPDSITVMITSDTSQAAALGGAAVPFCFRREDKLPIEYVSEAALLKYFTSWLGVYVHIPTIVAWHRVTELVPIETGLQYMPGGPPLLSTNYLWAAIRRAINWYLGVFCIPGFKSGLRSGNYSKYKYCVNCVYPGVTIATTPFWIECGEMMEYFAEFP